VRTAALLNSGMTDVKRQSSVFQAMLDDQSELDMNVKPLSITGGHCIQCIRVVVH
jgi:hypothetical protein